MTTHRIALWTVVAAFLIGGFIMSQSPPPPPYSIPEELAWYSPTFRCPTGMGEKFSNYVAWDGTEKRVVVGIQEKHPTTGEWAAEQFVYSTSYHVLDVAWRLGGQELYVAGIQLDRDGGYTDILEQWTFPTAVGSYAITVSGGVTPVGVPRGTLSVSISIVGGTYVPLSERTSTAQHVPEKKVLHTKKAGGHIDSLAADPEGRFLVMHNYTSDDLLTLDLLDSGSSPQVVYTASQISALATVRSIVLHDVPSVGRICRLSPENRNGACSTLSTQVAVLVDPQNDGSFNSFTVHSNVDLARGLTPYGESKNWGSVTNFGWDWQSEY